MNQEKGTSPFAALTYQEQQDRWLEWRSRQLDYQPVERMAERDDTEYQEEKKATEPSAYVLTMDPPPLKLPYFSNPAPTRHRELDKLRERHAQAVKMAGVYQKID